MNWTPLVLVCGIVVVYGKKSRGGSNGKENKDDKIWETKKYKFCSYDSVLSNVFYKEADITEKKFKRQVATIKASKTWSTTSDPKDLPQRQLQHYLNRKSHHQRSAASYCCETTWTCISPEIVEYNGKDYDVYQPDAGFQLVFQGQCGAGATCQHGTCTEEDDYYTWIIITVTNVNYDPPILFVPVTFNNFRYCATI